MDGDGCGVEHGRRVSDAPSVADRVAVGIADGLSFAHSARLAELVRLCAAFADDRRVAQHVSLRVGLSVAFNSVDAVRVAGADHVDVGVADAPSVLQCVPLPVALLVCAGDGQLLSSRLRLVRDILDGGITLAAAVGLRVKEPVAVSVGAHVTQWEHDPARLADRGHFAV